MSLTEDVYGDSAANTGLLSWSRTGAAGGSISFKRVGWQVQTKITSG
jgi:hypothetical protein